MANTGGRLAEAYTGSSTSKTTDIGFVYSVRGELTEIWESTPNSGGYYHPTAAFWPNGTLSGVWISKIPAISYGADGEGRISTVSASSGTNPVTAVSYNVASQLTSATFGSSDSISYTYDSNTGRMTQYKLAINGSATYGNLTWNPNGTVQKLAITDPFNTADAQTCTYLYDDLGRIGLPPASTGKSVDCGVSTWQQNFSYDAFGNLTKTVPTGGTGISWQPTYSNSTNRYTVIPGATPTYDANGNDSFHTYTWDAEGRPVTVDGLGLTYDALGRMVEVKNGTNYTQYVWWPSSQKFVIMNGQTLSSAFVPLPGGAEVKYLSSGLSVYRMPDWLGSLRAASNPNRTYNGSLAFAPFGERYAVSGTPTYAFTGQRADTVTDEYDFVFRKYHSTQGRWISPDPAGLAAVEPENPQTWNRYAYVTNNPCGLTDPLGLATRCNLSLKLIQGPGVDIGSMRQFTSELQRIFGAAGVGIQLTSGPANFTFNVAHATDLPPNYPNPAPGWDPSFGPNGWGAIDNLDLSSKWNIGHLGLAVARVASHEMGHFILQAGHTPADFSEGPGNLMEPGGSSANLLFGTSSWINGFWAF